MFYKIVASRGDSAYVEKLNSVKLVGEGRVFCEPLHGSCYFAHIDQIIKDCDIAEIIHKSTDWLYKVRLENVWGLDQKGGDLND